MQPSPCLARRLRFPFFGRSTNGSKSGWLPCSTDLQHLESEKRVPHSIHRLAAVSYHHPHSNGHVLGDFGGIPGFHTHLRHPNRWLPHCCSDWQSPALLSRRSPVRFPVPRSHPRSIQSGDPSGPRESGLDLGCDFSSDSCRESLKMWPSLASGKHTKSYGKSLCFMCKSTINHHFQ